MNTNNKTLLQALGVLRAGLIGLALLNILLPLLALALPLTINPDEHSMWSIITTVVTPVLAPVLMTVLLFEYVMSRIRAADTEGEERAGWTAIARVELATIGISLLFWIPYFAYKLT